MYTFLLKKEKKKIGKPHFFISRLLVFPVHLYLYFSLMWKHNDFPSFLVPKSATIFLWLPAISTCHPLLLVDRPYLFNVVRMSPSRGSWLPPPRSSAWSTAPNRFLPDSRHPPPHQARVPAPLIASRQLCQRTRRPETCRRRGRWSRGRMKWKGTSRREDQSWGLEYVSIFLPFLHYAYLFL